MARMTMQRRSALRLCIWMPCGGGENAITIAFGTTKKSPPSRLERVCRAAARHGPTANTVYGSNENGFSVSMKQPFCGMVAFRRVDAEWRTWDDGRGDGGRGDGGRIQGVPTSCGSWNPWCRFTGPRRATALR